MKTIVLLLIISLQWTEPVGIVSVCYMPQSSSCEILSLGHWLELVLQGT